MDNGYFRQLYGGVLEPQEHLRVAFAPRSAGSPAFAASSDGQGAM